MKWAVPGSTASCACGSPGGRPSRRRPAARRARRRARGGRRRSRPATIRVGAAIARMSSSGQAKGVVSSASSFSTSVGKSPGFGAIRRYSSSIGRPGEHLRRDRREHLERRGLHAVAGETGGRDDELAHQRRDGGSPAAARCRRPCCSRRRRPVDLQVSQQRGGVVGHLLVRERAIGVGRAPVPLLLERDHLPGLGQPRQERTHRVDRHVGAVQQDHGRPAPWIS